MAANARAFNGPAGELTHQADGLLQHARQMLGPEAPDADEYARA